MDKNSNGREKRRCNMYNSGIVALEQVSQILTSGVFPIGFTLFSWDIAAKLAMKLRK